MTGAPFDYLHHLVTLPVTAAGHDTRFVLDSGIRLTLVTDRFAVRRFGAFRGRIHPVGAPAIAQEDPDVMFQDIRYGGLVGDAFLRRFAVTFDIPARRLVFS
jgi:hypothetical protein